MLNEGPKVPKPEAFAAAVAESDGYELAAAQTALAQSRHPQVREFAQHMLTEHEKMAQTLLEAAKSAGVIPPKPHVGSDQARLLSGLQSLRGADFDREYARQQMLAHTSALTTIRRYADKGSDESLRRFAAASAPIIDAHLQMARQLQQSLK